MPSLDFQPMPLLESSHEARWNRTELALRIKMRRKTGGIMMKEIRKSWMKWKPRKCVTEA